MKRRNVSTWIKSIGVVVVLSMAGVANAKTIQLGSVDSGSYSFADVVNPGQSFTNFVSFSLGDAAQVSSFVKSFDFSIFSFDLLGIDNFSATLQQLGQGGFQTVASLSSNPISFDDFLGPGDYRIAIGGIGSGLFGGLYTGSLQVAVVPEAEVWVMLLVGFGMVVYQLRRKQRLLELQPVAA